MPRPKPLPPALAEAPFAVSTAASTGVSRARLRASDLNAPFHGVRVTARPSDLRSLAHACVPRLLPGQVFSHSTAAFLLGMRLPDGFHDETLHVTSVAPTRASRAAGITGHQAARADVIVTVEGLPVTAPLETWCQLSAVFSLEDLIVAGDGLVRRIRPQASLAQVRAAASQFNGRGARRLRSAAAEVRSGTDSARETKLRRFVVLAGFPEPEVNGVIMNSYGAQIAHGDLVFRAQRTILEYDGGQHRTSDTQFSIDIDRLDALMEDRWRVIRVDKYLMARRATLLGKIDTALRQGGWNPDHRAR